MCGRQVMIGEQVQLDRSGPPDEFIETPAAVVRVESRTTGLRYALRIALSGALIVLVWSGLVLWGLGKTPFHTKGEPREGLVVWEMTHGGGWILPRRNGTEVPSKPPLFHWLGALTSLAHGATDEWSIRLPSAALSLLALLCVFAAGCALWTPQAGLLSALALLTMFEWARAATSARVDMTLTFGLEVAFLSLLFFLRSRAVRWLIPLYLGISVAVLGKGPVGALLPGLVALLMFGLTRDLTPLRQMRLPMGILCVGVIAGSWYALALLVGGDAFFRKQILAENLFTFVNHPGLGSGGHRHSGLYLLGMLLIGLMPWALFLPAVASRAWGQRRAIGMRDARVFLCVWVAVVFGFYALAASKRGVYLLGLYPAVALLLGWWADERSLDDATTDRWLARALSVIASVFIAVAALLFVVVLIEGLGAPLVTSLQHWLPPSAQQDLPAISDTIRNGRWPLLACLIVAGAALYTAHRAARTINWIAIFGAVFIATAAIVVAVSQVILPGVAQRQTLHAFMDDVRQVVGEKKDLFFYKTFDYGAVFYWQAHIPSYKGPAPDGAPRYLLMQQAGWEQTPVLRDHYEPVRFANDGRGRQARLVLLRRIDAQ